MMKPFSEKELSEAGKFCAVIQDEFANNVIGQQDLANKLLVGLLAKGHVLLEGVPGLAKTRAIKVIAKILNLNFKRIQFTPDLLPSDVVGNLIFNPQTAQYITRQGPIFTNILLADEINRAPAKVQSALLEGMQENQVTIGGTGYALPAPFFVLATQNPIEQEGTYPLPEAQVDRFLLKTSVGYPEPDAELKILDLIEKDASEVIKKTITLENLLFLQNLTALVYIDPKIKQYIISIVFASRHPDKYGAADLKNVIEFGASPRGSIAFMLGAKAVALLNGRMHVIPEDIKYLRYDVLKHRIIFSYEAESKGISKEQVIDEIFQTVKVP
ncbi:MAG: MoxR family ATPase [bacterium]